jgi:LPS O-antigen subunit length determinant protein (WzzB/FepE family)
MGRRPVHNPQTERDVLKNKLYELHYLVPDADAIDLSQLRDIVQYAEQKVVAEKLARVQAGAEIASKMSPEQLKQALKEYLEWRKRKRAAAGVDIYGRK